MANLLLLDSNFYINYARAGIDPFMELSAFADDWEFAICGMVALEVCRGRRDPNIFRRFQEYFATMVYLPTTNAVWERTVSLAWTMDRRGDVIPAQDIIIAACALAYDATLLTADGHFQNIPGLAIVTKLG